MGFWFPSISLGFQSALPYSPHSCPIFFFEAFVVLMAIHTATCYVPRGTQVAVFSDNLNTVSMFNSLAALPHYNPILLAAVDIFLSHDFDFRVFHIHGSHNVVADALSHWDNEHATRIIPDLDVHTFQPPWDVLGAASQ
ncbi:hypothetical protein ID866_13084 [Astraeus odoratus]|nr:hypothetical protein ID866_13084 [Astraeus odoratus]